MNRIVWSLAAAAALLIPVVGTAETVGGKVEKSRDGWSEVVDHVVDTQLGGTLSLVVETGGIEVETWGKKQVRVVVEKEAEVYTEVEARKIFEDYPVDIITDDTGVRVSAEPGSWRRSRSLDISVRVVVPREYSVDVETGSGGISIDDLRGDAKARTDGGGINVGSIKGGSVDVETGGGGIGIEDIEGGDGRAVTGGGGISVRDVSGNLVARSSGGGINVGKVGGDLVIDTGGGGIGVKDCEGAVTVETGGGGISIVGTGGPVVAETGGGGIGIRDAGGMVRADTGGGGVGVEGADGPVVVQTGGGGITIEDARGYIEARTGGGGISAELAISDSDVDTHCNLETGGGDVTIILPGDLKATVDAELRLDRPRREYTIESDFDLQIEGDPDRSRRLTAQGSINGGGDLIRIRTTNGDVRIERR